MADIDSDQVAALRARATALVESARTGESPPTAEELADLRHRVRALDGELGVLLAQRRAGGADHG